MYAEQSWAVRDELAALRWNLEGQNRSCEEAASAAVRCCELSQSLKERWVVSDVRAKRQILEIVGLNYRMCGVTLVVEKRKPFGLLAEGHFSLSMVEAPGIEPGSGPVRARRLRA